MECAASNRHLCLQAGVLSLMRALGSMIMLRCACAHNLFRFILIWQHDVVLACSSPVCVTLCNKRC